MLRQRYQEGAAFARAKLGLAQPSLGAVGIKSPTKAPGLPGPASVPAIGKPSLKLDGGESGGGGTGLGLGAAKTGANVGLGASTSTDGAGGTRGEPDDMGRRQRSVIDRAFQANEDSAATSSMPLPGDTVSP